MSQSTLVLDKIWRTHGSFCVTNIIYLQNTMLQNNLQIYKPKGKTKEKRSCALTSVRPAVQQAPSRTPAPGKRERVQLAAMPLLSSQPPPGPWCRPTSSQPGFLVQLPPVRQKLQRHLVPWWGSALLHGRDPTATLPGRDTPFHKSRAHTRKHHKTAEFKINTTTKQYHTQ